MTSIKKEIITQFEGSTFASHEDVVEWLSQALTRVEEAAREEKGKETDEI